MSYKNQILKQLTNGKFGKKTYLDLVRKKGNVTPKNEVFVNKSYPIIDEESDKMDKLIGEIKRPVIRDVEFNDIDDVNYENDNILDDVINNDVNDTNDKNNANDKNNTNDKIEPIDKPEIIVNTQSKSLVSPPKKICSSPKRKRPVPKKKPKHIPPRKIPVKKLPPKSVVPKETVATNSSKFDDIFTEQTEITPVTTLVIKSDKKSPDNEQIGKKIKTIEEKILELEDYVVEIGIEIENLKKNQNNIINVINKLTIDINIAKNKITR
ncbi:hypothetical protein QJ857_gp1033 [Tupanvirus soda lake]|uniref:Uncharacterized protein n=2 Tax=Tupanvirus TaxID=2094720 RepID=A0A6N1P1W1_9VIRU|nr:hypothetical protein QJ857_gp1033 [Tupanvirus soda lake]QKU35021.1 hypothetical protein [Tupanvirus soda lake]